MKDTHKNNIKLLVSFIIGAVISTVFYSVIELSSPESRIKKSCVENGGTPQVIFNYPEYEKQLVYGTIECIFKDD